MKIISVVGARPNFMKVAPVHSALLAAGYDAVLVHTGQHYDTSMSEVFVKQLKMPPPLTNLGVGPGSHGRQTAQIMERFEPVLSDLRPAVVLVAGDVNSSLACALVAAKEQVPVVHLEAGLRSYDRSMPEETNRVLIDHMSSMWLTPSPDACENLAAEGIAGPHVVHVGNTMIDSLRANLQQAQRLAPKLLESLGVAPKQFALLTLHRPANVDVLATLRVLWSAVLQIAAEVPLLFVVHPRTLSQLQALPRSSRVRNLPALGYLEFLALQQAAQFVLTDSGGIQEETTALGVPCLTLRLNTERPITLTEGSNTLVGHDPERIVDAAQQVLAGAGRVGHCPALWDGQAAGRVVTALAQRWVACP